MEEEFMNYGINRMFFKMIVVVAVVFMAIAFKSRCIRENGEDIYAAEKYAAQQISENVASDNEKAEVADVKVSNKESLNRLLLKMFTTDDTEWHDVSALKMTSSELYSYRYMRAEENSDFYVAFYSGAGVDIDTKEDSNGYATAICVTGKDEDYVNRYTKVKKAISEAMSGISSDMNDFEKALVLHDYLDEHTRYVVNDNDNNPGYTLANGIGVCGGYASAYNMLLKVAGIKSHSVFSSNHAWNLVTINGKQYHVDATWDDTKMDGKMPYCYFMRNSASFKKDHPKWTSYVYDDTADSDIYNKWFGRKLSSRMKYYKGRWYYVLDGKIMSSKVDGTSQKIFVKSSETLQIKSIKDGKIYYLENGKEHAVNI